MWLLNTSTRKLQEFGGPEQVQYAILSHRWTEEEVTFEDVKDLESCSKKGVSKVISFCRVALELGYDWCWIDTCCINKASSAELSEAINSMFNWYQKSGVCIIYLQDVEAISGVTIQPATRTVDEGESCRPPEHPLTASFDESEFRASTWFLRSWTLQELLASARSDTFYYNKTWQRLGSRNSLSTLVSEITTINEAALLGQSSLSDYSVAERMSWASMRSATRIEDVAYSLLGIFDIQMPLVYGEGVKAFRRLQQAIMLDSADETIFAWAPVTSGEVGLLARSPLSFANSRNLASTRCKWHGVGRSAYELMSRGAKFDSAQNIRIDKYVHALLLNVTQDVSEKVKQQIGIYVRINRHQTGYDRVWVPLEDQLYRVNSGTEVKTREGDRSFYIPFDQGESIVDQFEPEQPEEPPSYTERMMASKRHSGYDLTIVPPAMLQPTQEIIKNGIEYILKSKKGGPVCNINFTPPFHGVSLVHLGIDGDRGLPVCAILSAASDGFQTQAIHEKLGSSIRDLTIDYSTVQPIERKILPDRTNDGKDWHIDVWPPQPDDEVSWYQVKPWQHPKQQPDLNYFCPFPFNPWLEQGDSKRPVTKHQGWGVELLKIGQDRWKFGLVKYSIVSSLGSKVNESLLSKILASRPRSLMDCTYSIDLDTFKSVKRFPVMDA